MKKILLLLASIIITATTYAQVLKYRAYQTQTGEYSQWDDRNILVVLNIEKDNIHIYGQQETDLSILYAEPSVEKNDGIAYFYSAVDQDGDRCRIMFKRFILDGNNNPNENVATLCIIYPSIMLSMRLKND